MRGTRTKRGRRGITLFCIRSGEYQEEPRYQAATKPPAEYDKCTG
jgi:hypothetical protein